MEQESVPGGQVNSIAEGRAQQQALLGRSLALEAERMLDPIRRAQLEVQSSLAFQRAKQAEAPRLS